MTINKTLSLVAAAGVLFAASCNNPSTTSTTATDSSAATAATAPMPDTSSKMAAAPASNADQDFINIAGPGNMKEIAWLQAGIARGGKAVKEHAKMMLTDHTALAAKMKDIITKNNFTMPAMDTAGAVTINDKTGKDWDKAWVDKMVADHKDLLDKLKSSEGQVKNADVKSLITSTIPVVQKHLDMVSMIQGTMK